MSSTSKQGGTTRHTWKWRLKCGRNQLFSTHLKTFREAQIDPQGNAHFSGRNETHKNVNVSKRNTVFPPDQKRDQRSCTQVGVPATHTLRWSSTSLVRSHFEAKNGGFPRVMAIAFISILCLRDLCKVYSLDVRWIDKIRLAVAQSFLNCFDAMMSVIRTALTDRSPEVFVSSPAFGSASGVSSRAAQRSSWHVLVSQQHVSWVTKDAQGRTRQRWMNFDSGTSSSDKNFR